MYSLDMEQIWESIRNCEKSLFRFEGLQDYSAEDGEAIVRHFIQTGTLKEIPNEENAWWSAMKVRNEKGILTQRVRLVLEPRTDYLNMELEYLRRAKEYSGDDIRIINEIDLYNIAPSGLEDFYIIDDTKIFIMKYGPKGKYIHSRVSGDVIQYSKLKEKLLQSSLPI